PTEADMAGVPGSFERVAAMARAMFEWWIGMEPGFDHLRADRRRIPEVEAWMADVSERHRSLAAAALGQPDEPRVALLVALTSADAWTALRKTGSDPTAAAAQVATVLLGSPVPPSTQPKEIVH